MLSAYLRCAVSPPVASADAISTAAAMLCDAKAPVIAADRAIRTQAGMEMLVALAEALNAPMQQAFDRMRANAKEAAARAWDATPISTARLSAEVWNAIRHEPWALVSPTGAISQWPQRLWDFKKTFIGAGGGYGVGYAAPAAVGAAIAHRDAGRIAVSIQTDGDLMVLPGVLWTAAHHSLPLLTVMHNNRAWHQETMHIQRMSSRRDRHPERGTIGTVLHDPPIDYAAMAKSMGMCAEGPISDPDALGPALVRAMQVVKSGKPALVDVLTQPR